MEQIFLIVMMRHHNTFFVTVLLKILNNTVIIERRRKLTYAYSKFINGVFFRYTFSFHLLYIDLQSKYSVPILYEYVVLLPRSNFLP